MGILKDIITADTDEEYISASFNLVVNADNHFPSLVKNYETSESSDKELLLQGLNSIRKMLKNILRAHNIQSVTVTKRSIDRFLEIAKPTNLLKKEVEPLTKGYAIIVAQAEKIASFEEEIDEDMIRDILAEESDAPLSTPMPPEELHQTLSEGSQDTIKPSPTLSEYEQLMQQLSKKQ